MTAAARDKMSRRTSLPAAVIVLSGTLCHFMRRFHEARPCPASGQELDEVLPYVMPASR